jgi:hypothetical protein
LRNRALKLQRARQAASRPTKPGKTEYSPNWRFARLLLLAARVDHIVIFSKCRPEKRWDQAKFVQLKRISIVAVALLIVLCFLAFAPVLRAYFIADDFVPMAYLYQGFHGHAGELLAKLFQPWQDPTVQLMYRPVCELTMMLDYALFGPSAVGFHFSNVLWHAAATVAFYFVCKEMVAKLDDAPRFLPFGAAALFATYPLHTETVAWMIGRVDSVCAAFYFGAMLCFMRRRQVLGLVLFALALFSKEMAVTLPAVLLAYAFIVERKSFRDAVLAGAGYWALLVPYFGIRLAVLGTFLGGYIGSVGVMFQKMFEERFVHCRWDKIFYPYSDFGLNESSIAVRALRLVYAGLAAVALLRWRTDGWRQPAVRMAAFSAVWFALCLAPAMTVWYLNGALTGGRFLYLGSAPLLLFLCSLVMGPSLRVASMAVGGLVAIYCFMTFANANVWVASGERAVKLHAAVEAALRTTPPQRRVVLLNTPKQANDEHLYYTPDMLHSFFRPPFSASDLSDRIACTQPNFYLPETPNNVSRLRQMAESGRFDFYSWDDKAATLTPVAPDVVLAGMDDTSAIPTLLPSREAGSDSFVRTPVAFAYDLSSIPQATQAVAEVTKANCCFVHYTRSYRDTKLNADDGCRIALTKTPRGEFSIPSAALQRKAHYQVRIAALDAHGNVIGTVSDPVSIDTTK